MGIDVATHRQALGGHARRDPMPRRRAVRSAGPVVRRLRDPASVREGEHLLALTLGQAAPDSVRLVNLQRVPPAGQQRRAAGTHGLRLCLAAGSRWAPLALGVEEVGAGHSATCRVQLPLPHIGIGARKTSGVCHRVPLLDHSGPTPRTTPTKGDAVRIVLWRLRPVPWPPHPYGCPCSHRIRSDAGAAVVLTIELPPAMIKTAPDGRVDSDPLWSVGDTGRRIHYSV